MNVGACLFQEILVNRIARIGLVASIACATGAITACATAGGPVSRPEVRTVRFKGVDGGLQIRHDDQSTATIIALPLEQVWRALPMVFDSLEVPVSLVDPAGHVFGNEGVRIRKRIGGAAISRYFDCGTTQIGPNADSYDVFLVLLTTLQAGPANTTTITITAEASARPVARSQPYNSCASRATLNARVVELLKRQAMR